jgi:hypothetical protein
VASSFECGNELPGSIKCRKFLDWLRTNKVLKKDCCMELFLVLCEVL